MKSLFPPNFNWAVFLIIGLAIRFLFIDLSGIGFIAIMISLHQFMLLFDSISHFISVRYLLGSFMCVQYLLGPTFAYNGLDQYQYFEYRMAIPEVDYFLYAIPAVLAFITGVHLFAGNLKGEKVNEQGIMAFVQKNPKLPYTFIVMGLFASVASSYFSTELAFVFYLLGSFKFIGLFLLVLGSKQLKVLPVVIVIGSIVSSSFGEGMFHDLLTWVIFTGSVFAIKYKISFQTKIIGAAGFVLFALTLQILKGAFRNSLGHSGGENGVEAFGNLVKEQNQTEKGLFSYEKIAESNVRINQGFIQTNIMLTIPDKEPFSNGEEMGRVLQAALLPRILAPNKLNAGDRDIVYRYSRIKLSRGTSMGLGSLGDAYINYGIFGGCIFMFLLGLLYCAVLNVFYRNSLKYPVLVLFTALVFYYPIRPDCELQTILGHLFKSVFLIFVIINIWKYEFYVPNKKLVLQV